MEFHRTRPTDEELYSDESLFGALFWIRMAPGVENALILQGRLHLLAPLKLRREASRDTPFPLGASN
jgi:hypothetical protein